MPFDSIQIRFKNVKEWPSPLANTRVVPFVNSYFEVIKSCIEDIRTEYFWVFASFLKLDDVAHKLLSFNVSISDIDISSLYIKSFSDSSDNSPLIKHKVYGS